MSDDPTLAGRLQSATPPANPDSGADATRTSAPPAESASGLHATHTAASSGDQGAGAVRTSVLTGAAESTGGAVAARSTATGADRTTPPRIFGRYQILGEVAHGAMGVVYRAWDPSLRREVALKVMASAEAPSADAFRRFEREALLAARAQHPNLVPVHEVGRWEDQLYYTMELVDGESVQAVLRRAGRLPPRHALRIARDCARALQAAHEQKLVHRDVKPANILLSPQPGADDPAGLPIGSRQTSNYRVLLADFGIAKDVASQTLLTRPDAVVGTPAYMSPEQAGHPDRMGPRSDIYSLGVVLYHLLAGKPPFVDPDVMRLLATILGSDPPPLRSHVPGLAVDVELIVAKAMRKEPESRYATAAEFADDLERCLDNRPIHARPATHLYRIRRWALHNARILILGGTVALLPGAVALGNWFSDQAAGRERERLEAEQRVAERERARLEARHLDTVRERAGLYVDAALSLRRAGLSIEKARREFLPKMIEAAADAERELRWSPEPPYNLGRMHRALMNPDLALQQQDRALEKDPRFAPALYERGVLRIGKFRERLLELDQAWRAAEGRRLAQAGALGLGGAAGERMRPTPALDDLVAADETARRLRAQVGEDLEALLAAGPAAVGSLLPAWTFSCARGLVLAYLGKPADRAEARRLLEEAIQATASADASPESAVGPQEAYQALADLAMAEGNRERAIECWSRGIAAEPGYGRNLVQRAEARSAWGCDRSQRGEDPTDLFAAAVADCSSAIALDAGDATAWKHRGRVQVNWGANQSGRGADPIRHWESAVADFAKALELDPNDAQTWSSRGQVRGSLLMYRARRGENPVADFDAAIADYARSLELDSARPETWVFRSMVRSNWGVHRFYRGEDPEPFYAAAIADLDQALQRDPSLPDAWSGRGNAHLNWGVCKNSRDEDPGGVYTAAIADYGKALDLDPGDPGNWAGRALARINWGYHRIHHGGDPSELLEAAIADLGHALERNPSSVEGLLKRGLARSMWAFYQGREGKDPRPLMTAAIGDFDRALTLNPASEEAWTNRGLTRANLGKEMAAHGEDPRPSYVAALADYDEAVKLNPVDFEALWRRGQVHACLEEWPEAIADLEAAGRANPAEEPRLRPLLAEVRERQAAANGTQPAWRASLHRGAAAVQANRYPDARTAYEAGLAGFAALPEAEQAAALADPFARDALRHAHYDLACCLSLQSVGKPTTTPAPTPVDSAAAARLREEAFAHLRSALALGQIDARHLRADMDLAPLHNDARWAEFVQDVERRK